EKEEGEEEIKPAAKRKTKKEEAAEKESAAAVSNQEIVEPTEDAELPQVIENIKAQKIEGPKILGKIDLPVDNDTRPKKEEKRKRKRIPIEKKEVKKEDLFKDRRDGGGNRGGGGHFNRDNRPGDRRGGTAPGGRRDNR